MRVFARLLFVAAAVVAIFASCEKKESGRLVFDNPALFFATTGTTQTVGFSVSANVKSLTVSSKPEGWEDPVIDMANRRVTISAPKAIEGKVVNTGTMTLTGVVPGGALVSASLFVGVVSTVDLQSKVANSYIASKKETNYLIDASRKGDGTAISPSSVKVIWQTASNLLRYVQLKGTTASFYLSKNDDDELKAGNALLGAYDSKGKLLWSWHIWVSDFDPEATALTYSNGYTVMSRNLGAIENKNSTNEEILASLGLYYQWGRKEPFVGPLDYKSGSGISATMYSGSGARVTLVEKASDATVGTEEYARENPLCFITGVKDSEYDWLWSGHSTARWADVKTVNDPCPYGWQVAPMAAFDGLTITEDLNADYSAYEGKYGWTLASGGVSSLYMAAGRRVYTDGKFQNVYNPLPVRSTAMEAQPWVGLYWTTKMDNTRAGSFFFWFNKQDVAASGLSLTETHYRANGMSVRCVKVK